MKTEEMERLILPAFVFLGIGILIGILMSSANSTTGGIISSKTNAQDAILPRFQFIMEPSETYGLTCEESIAKSTHFKFYKVIHCDSVEVQERNFPKSLYCDCQVQ